MNLGEIRKTYPQYDDLSDDQLIDSFHAKFYSDIPRDEFASTINPPKDRGIFGHAKDTAIDLAKGVVGFGESIVGIGSIVTGGAIGKGLQSLGYEPKQTQEFLSGFQSDARKQSESNVQKADGFIDTAIALGANPSVLIGGIVQSLPGTVGAGAVGGLFVKNLATTALAEAGTLGLTGEAASSFVANKVKEQAFKIAAVASGAEGAQSAGSIAEAGRQAGSDWSTYVAPALAAGLGTAAIGIVSGKIASKVGIGDVETDIAARAAGVKGVGVGSQSMAKRVPLEMLKEGVLEEMPQSAQEQVFQNLATNRPYDEGAGSAAAQGLLAGAGMAGGHSVISGRQEQQNNAPAIPQEPQGQPQEPQQTPVAPPQVTPEKADEYIRMYSRLGKPMHLQDAQDAAVSAAEIKGVNYSVIPHAKTGYTIIPSEKLTPDMANGFGELQPTVIQSIASAKNFDELISRFEGSVRTSNLGATLAEEAATNQLSSAIGNPIQEQQPLIIPGQQAAPIQPEVPSAQQREVDTYLAAVDKQVSGKALTPAEQVLLRMPFPDVAAPKIALPNESIQNDATANAIELPVQYGGARRTQDTSQAVRSTEAGVQAVAQPAAIGEANPQSIASATGTSVPSANGGVVAEPALKNDGEHKFTGRGIFNTDGLTRDQAREFIRGKADNLASTLQEKGFDVKVDHSGSAAGPSSYLSVSDPKTGRLLGTQIRLSNHSKGVFNSKGVLNVGSDKDISAILRIAEKMRESGSTELQSKKLDDEKAFNEGRGDYFDSLVKSANKKIAKGKSPTNNEKDALKIYDRLNLGQAKTEPALTPLQKEVARVKEQKIQKEVGRNNSAQIAQAEDAAPEDAQKPEQPSHIEGKQEQAATPQVIAESIKKSADKTPMNMREAKADLLKKIDDAIVNAPDSIKEVEIAKAQIEIAKKIKLPVSKDRGLVEKALADKNEQIKLAESKIKQHQLTFDVEGDGSFKVLNIKSKLKDFKAKVDKSSGFSTAKSTGFRGGNLALGNTTPTTIVDMLKDGEELNAYELAKLSGKPLRFTENRQGDIKKTNIYLDAKNIPDMPHGLSAYVGKTPKGKWTVIENTSGQRLGKESETSNEAIKSAKESAGKATKDQIDRAISSHNFDEKALEKKWLEAYGYTEDATEESTSSPTTEEVEAEPQDVAAKAEAILDAANIKGKERLDTLKDVKSGALTVDEVARAHPSQEEKPLLSTAPKTDSINVDGVDRPRTNSKGQSIAQTDAALRNFWKWFGDSKVADSDGKPLVVYHGTRSDFSVFDPERTGQESDSGWFGKGIYLTQKPEDASIYAQTNLKDDSQLKPQGSVMPVFVRALNPYITEKAGLSDAAILSLKKAGHDAIFSADDEIVVFDPDQIKSAIGNNGQFSTEETSILKSESQAKSGTTKEEVKKAAALLRAKWVGFTKINVVQSVDDLPSNIKDRIQADAQTEGFYDPQTKSVYLIADNISSPERAVWVAAHETIGHAGLRMLKDKTINEALDMAGKNQFIGDLAKAIKQDRSDVSEQISIEEAIAEYAAAIETGDYQGIADRYQIDVPTSAKTGIKGAVARVIEAIKRFLGVMSRSEVSNADVLDLINAQRAAVEYGGEEQSFTGDAVLPSGKIVQADIRYSKSTVGAAYEMLRDAKTLSSITDGVKDALSSSGKMNLWDRTIGTQFNKSKKDADFKRVFDAYNQQTDDTAHYAIEAEKEAPTILQRLDSLKDVGKAIFKSGAKQKADIDAVSTALFANIEGKRGVQQKVFTDAELRSEFNLTDYQIGMYRQVRKSVDTSIDRLAQTYIASMGQSAGMDISTLKNLSLSETAKAVKDGTDDGSIGKNIGGMTKDEGLHERIDEIVQQSAGLKQAGYMPAMRFGQYAVTVTDPKSKGDPLHFEMFESQTAANIKARQLEREYPGMQVDRSIMNPDQFAMFKGVSPETVELFAKFSGQDQTEAYKDYIALAKSGRSTMKRMLERKGVAGFSEDLTRVLASFVTSNARQSAMNMNNAEINSAMASKSLAKKGDVQREAQKLHEYMANPREEAQAIRGFMFMHFLGGSVASAAVNLTQPVLQTAPYLSQFAGVKTAKIMASAAKMAANGDIKNAELKAAFDRAQADGITEPHEIHHLMADATGSTLGNSLRARALTKAWGSFFSLSEAFNRRLTFLAAYQTAQGMSQSELEAAGFKDAYKFAANAIIETQGLYSKTNRPNWARGAVGATLFTFKQFSISYVEFLNRLPMKQKMLALAILVLAAGLQGLPFADDIEDLIDTIGQSMGYNTNSKKALHKILVDQFGKDLGEVLAYGISTRSGVDLQGRLGMGNLIPGTGLLKMSEKDKSRDVAEIAGPLGSILTSFQKAFSKMQAGDITSKTGALASLAPVAIRNLLQGAEMAETGIYKDTKGRKVQDVDVIDSVVKSLGFQPSKIASESRIISDMMQDIGMVKAVEESIATRWAQGITDKDFRVVMDARKALKAWNENNPESRIAITGSQINQRIKQNLMSREQRFIKSTPKDIKASIIKDMRQ